MYFVTTKNLGKKPLIKPIATNCENGRKPAICVAPTVFQCLIGIAQLDYTRFYYPYNGEMLCGYRKRKKPFRIYRTDKKGYKVNIYDSAYTGERRLYRPTLFTFEGFVEEEIVGQAEKLCNILNNR